MSRKNKRRNWVVSMLEETFRAWVSERDYQIVQGIQKYYNPVFSGKNEEADLFLVNIAYQIGKMEGRKEG